MRVCAEVSAGLAAAHSHVILYRDVKPANVVLTEAGARILGFGIAAKIGHPDRLPDGIVLDRPAYMAAERFDGGPVAPPLDMYGVGVLLYRCLTTRLPWDVDTDEAMLQSHRSVPTAADDRRPPPGGSPNQYELPPCRGTGLPAGLAATIDEFGPMPPGR